MFCFIVFVYVWILWISMWISFVVMVLTCGYVFVIVVESVMAASPITKLLLTAIVIYIPQVYIVVGEFCKGKR